MISGFHNRPIDTWSSSEQDVVIAQRSPTKIQPKLSVLLESARNDTSGSSDLELSKFGFAKSTSLSHSQTPTAPKSCIKFGSFSDPVNLDDLTMFQKRFVGNSFQQKLCEFLPVETLRKLQDLWQAGYSDPEIMEVLKIPTLPPKSLVNDFVISYSNAGLDEHSNQSRLNWQRIKCFKCLDMGHAASSCLLGWRCRNCKQIGHLACSCKGRQTKIWRVKRELAVRGPTVKSE
jgi:hypothetical protein